MISFDDIWDRDDAIAVLGSDQEVLKDPFITPRSHNLFYSGGKISPTHLIEGSQTADMNVTASLRGENTDSFDLLKLDTSPWHESDSGVSTIMSEAGSPSACNDYPATDFTETPVQPIVDWSELGEGAEDLAAYLLGTDVSMLESEEKNFSTQDTSAPQNSNTTSPTMNYLTVTKQNVPANSYDVNIDVENSDSECSNSGGISPERHNCQSQISEPLNYFQDVCGETKRKPAVKIVKVLKTSAVSDYCDDDIVKALDEKSRKNAIQAKMNREKKKKYVSSLEKDVEKLGKENNELRNENIELKKDLGSLEEEVRYLKSVLVNASALSSLLRNIGGVSDVKLSASIVGRKREASECEDHSYTSAAKVTRSDNGRAERSAKRAKMVSENLEKAGVCLHVSGCEASLEFCSKCSSLARQSHNQSKKS
ncbi:CREB/ATF bZIP transcription factor [Elysia marginata]|uniref:X-box-binding protein 1 n=1 Tax=Elysia marginata TaxID=1093978 RepID=A0AAV4F0I1_9GAST|nr:CREB/ATF bZIP transcription factor [Elysia marginata]